MPSLNRFRTRTTALALGALLTVAGPAAVAGLVSADWSWKGDKGWTAKGLVTWEESIAQPLARGSVYGLTNTGIDYLSAAFFKADGTTDGSWDQVLNGVVLVNHLSFTFDALALDLVLGQTMRVGKPGLDGTGDQLRIVPDTGSILLTSGKIRDRGPGFATFIERQPEEIPVSPPYALLPFALLLLAKRRRFLRA